MHPGGVLHAELEEEQGDPLQRVARTEPAGHDVGVHLLAVREEVGVAVGEHRVVDGVLAGEVAVQRRRPHADGVGDVAQRPPPRPRSRASAHAESRISRRVAACRSARRSRRTSVMALS